MYHSVIYVILVLIQCVHVTCSTCSLVLLDLLYRHYSLLTFLHVLNHRIIYKRQENQTTLDILVREVKALDPDFLRATNHW